MGREYGLALIDAVRLRFIDRMGSIISVLFIVSLHAISDTVSVTGLIKAGGKSCESVPEHSGIKRENGEQTLHQPCT